MHLCVIGEQSCICVLDVRGHAFVLDVIGLKVNCICVLEVSGIVFVLEVSGNVFVC